MTKHMGDAYRPGLVSAEAPDEIAARLGITDCDDEGCEECDVCRYLDFLEWAQSVGKPPNSTIERNQAIEAYLEAKDAHLLSQPLDTSERKAQTT